MMAAMARATAVLALLAGRAESQKTAADERFHASLVDLCGNRQLAATVWNYWDRAHRARMFSLRLRPKPINSTREHMELVERMRAGDAIGAAHVNRQHRERASRELLKIFEQFKLAQM